MNLAKQLSALMAAALATTATALAGGGVTIDGTVYQADTLLHRQIGPGVVNTVVRIPDYPLNVYVLETDLNNPYNRVETVVANNKLGGTERLSDSYTRNRTATKQPLAAVNSNFWCTTEEPYTQFMKLSPFGSCVRNDSVYTNNNNIVDKWIAGPENTGAVAIDHDKRMWLGRFVWTGLVASDKLGEKLSISEVNQRGLKNRLALFNGAYGRNREFETDWTAHSTRGDNGTCNYFLTLKQGSSWQVNRTMTFVVSKIVCDSDRMTLGAYDACLTASGTMATKMSALAEGDELTIDQGWAMIDDTSIAPHIENMVEGNALVMKGGELTDRNYLQTGSNDTYNNRAYSRTGMGTTPDGKHLYMIVIEMTNNPTYGRSAGCTTAVMCQILKSLCPDVTEITTHDAGGSAQMMVAGTVINKTTEGTPRAVENGLMLFSTAPAGDTQISSIAFDGGALKLPIYATTTPRVLGYNQYGELIDDNVQGFTLSCNASLGQCQGSTFSAGGSITTGTLTATLGGLTCSATVTTLAAEPQITLKPMLSIDHRSWPIEVTATVNAQTYSYDASRLQWTVADPTIATIEGGKLRGLQNGVTTITCSIGDFTDTDSVTVQIAPTPIIEQSWDEGWTMTGSGAKDFMLAADGTLSYTYSGGRAPYLAMSKHVQLYGLPDSVGITFTSSVPLNYVQIDARTPLITAINYQEHNNGGQGFEAGKTYTLALDMDQLGGLSHLTTYPISIEELRFSVKKSGSTAGAQTLQIASLFAHYPVAGDVDGNGTLNVTDLTTLVNIILGATPANLATADINGDGTLNATDVAALITLIFNQ